MRKKDLASSLSFALKRVVIRFNIMAGFKEGGIWPLNFEAMKHKMDPSEGFLP